MWLVKFYDFEKNSPNFGEFFVAHLVYNRLIMELLPQWYIICTLFLFGIIIGSFLDVFVSRFHTGTSINGRSRCMSCGHTLSWYELVPLLSFLILRGRCRSCNSKIPLRLLGMELVTGALFVYVYLTLLIPSSVFFGLLLATLLIIIAAYDMRHMIIPDEFVWALLGFALLLLGFSYQSTNIMFYIPHLLAACIMSLFFAALWLVSKGRWIGLGDAKLAFPLGLMLTPFATFSVIVFSFWIGAVVSIAVLLVQRLLLSGKHRLPFFGGPLTMKSEVPFAPFLIAAFILVFFEHIDVLAIMARLF